jgi:hypothetical protein
MFAQQSPALLINERWVRLLIFSRPDEDSAVGDFDNLLLLLIQYMPPSALLQLRPFEQKSFWGGLSI